MINISELKTFLEENSISRRNNPLLDFARKIKCRNRLNPFCNMSPVKHPDFSRVKEKIMDSEKEDDFVQRLLFYINKKKKTAPQVYNAAGMTPDCFSKIISGKTRIPTRTNIISLAFALELNLEEAQDLLARAGYYFPVPTIKEDIILQYCLEDKDGPHTIDEVNEALYHFGFNAIGGRN